MCNAWCLALLAAASATSSNLKESAVGARNVGDHTEFILITARGWVRFAVGADWKVLSMETKKPMKVALFQISSEADEGTPDSTNITVILYEMDSKEASDVFSATHHKAERGEKSLVEQWDVFKEQAKQEKTTYSVRTAFRDVADVHVAVRLGWPHLSKNAATYESEMEETFRALLSSLTGELGNYERRPGEFFQRPQ